jgi:hypothetical protein
MARKDSLFLEADIFRYLGEYGRTIREGKTARDAAIMLDRGMADAVSLGLAARQRPARGDLLTFGKAVADQAVAMLDTLGFENNPNSIATMDRPAVRHRDSISHLIGEVFHEPMPYQNEPNYAGALVNWQKIERDLEFRRNSGEVDDGQACVKLIGQELGEALLILAPLVLANLAELGARLHRTAAELPARRGENKDALRIRLFCALADWHEQFLSEPMETRPDGADGERGGKSAALVL